MRVCLACSGSGYYDEFGQECGACNGGGYTEDDEAYAITLSREDHIGKSLAQQLFADIPDAIEGAHQ